MREVHILHPQPQRFHEPHAGAVQQARQQGVLAFHLRQHRLHLPDRQDHRQSLYPPRTLHVVEPRQFLLEPRAIQEQQRRQGLVVGAGGHASFFIGQHGQERLDLRGTQLARMAPLKVTHEAMGNGHHLHHDGAPPGSGAFADVREVARAHVAAWQRDTWGRSFLLGGEHAAFLDLIGRIGARLRKPVPRRATPAFALKGYARMMELLARLRGAEPTLTAEAAQFTCHHLAVDSSRAVRELDYRITPLDALLDDTIAWMREHGMLAAR